MKKVSLNTIYNISVYILVTAVTAAIVIFPNDAVSAAGEGIKNCLEVIVPSLFPFLVMSKLIVNSGLADRAGRLLQPIMRKLFHLPGSCSAAMVLGYLSGYPVGAGIVAQLYARGSCSKSQAERLLAMCNNSGPAFILGVVGAKLFGSAAIGGIIYICHVLSSLAVCFVFRGRSEPCSPLTADHEKNQNFAQAFTASIKSSLVTVGSICGFVVFFRVIVKVMEITGIFRLLSFLPSKLLALSGIDSTIASALTSGIFELSTGICAIDISAGPIPAMACAAFLLGWAGISVHFQVLSLISGSGLSIKKYLAGKLLHAVFATFFTAVAGIIFFQSAPTFSVPGYQVVSYISLFFICSAAAAAVFMAFLFFAAKAVKKHRNS